jgi:hypothetical protein
MATKNGLLESFVMRVTPTAAAPPVLVASEVPPRLQAVRAKAVEAAIETASTRRTDGFLRVMRVIVVYFSLGELASIDNVVFLLVC